jgi:hypothetical protein
MQNHYVARPLGFHDRLNTPGQSLVYRVIAQDRLVTQEEIIERVQAHLQAHPEEMRPAFGSTLDALRVKKRVVELLELLSVSRAVALVPGPTLQRLVAAM